MGKRTAYTNEFLFCWIFLFFVQAQLDKNTEFIILFYIMFLVDDGAFIKHQVFITNITIV